jgi:hypothetical protein
VYAGSIPTPASSSEDRRLTTDDRFLQRLRRAKM